LPAATDYSFDPIIWKGKGASCIFLSLLLLSLSDAFSLPASNCRPCGLSQPGG
jgi:hypothetical protein